MRRLVQEAATGGGLPPTAADDGLLASGQVSAAALVAAHGNRYSAPVAYAGLPVTIRRHRECVRIWRDTTCSADHRRAPASARQRVIAVAPFAPLFPTKPRARGMRYRQALLDLGGPAPAFLSARSPRQRAQLGPQVLGV